MRHSHFDRCRSVRLILSLERHRQIFFTKVKNPAPGAGARYIQSRPTGN